MKREHFAPAEAWWHDRQEITENGFPKARKFSAEELAGLGYNLDQCGVPQEEEEVLPPQELIRRYEEQRAAMNQDIDRILDEIARRLGGRP